MTSPLPYNHLRKKGKTGERSRAKRRTKVHVSFGKAMMQALLWLVKNHVTTSISEEIKPRNIAT